MDSTRKHCSWRSPLLPALLLVLAAGCATPPPPQEPVPDPPLESIIVDVSKRPMPAPPPLPPAQPPASLPLVAVVLSSRQPVYEDVALALDEVLDDYLIYDLSDRSQSPSGAFSRLNDSNAAAVIAIGLRAAQSAVAMANAPVVFAQVFNFHGAGLIGDDSRGVAAYAPLDAQLAAWKELDPTVAEIGLIVGKGHEDLVEEAELAADRHGVALRVHTAGSDQEALYLFKRMAARIDGFWLLPDSRIFSTRVLREIFDEANRRNVVVAVPNDAMLAMGGAISFTTSPTDVAAGITDLVRRIHQDGVEDIAKLTPLSELRVTTNDAVLERRVVARRDRRPDGDRE